jgi:hypothetical protein
VGSKPCPLQSDIKQPSELCHYSDRDVVGTAKRLLSSVRQHIAAHINKFLPEKISKDNNICNHWHKNFKSCKLQKTSHVHFLIGLSFSTVYHLHYCHLLMAPNRFSADACATKCSCSPHLPEHCIFLLPLTKDITRGRKDKVSIWGVLFGPLFSSPPLSPRG